MPNFRNLANRNRKLVYKSMFTQRAMKASLYLSNQFFASTKIIFHFPFASFHRNDTHKNHLIHFHYKSASNELKTLIQLQNAKSNEIISSGKRLLPRRTQISLHIGEFKRAEKLLIFRYLFSKRAQFVNYNNNGNCIEKYEEKWTGKKSRKCCRRMLYKQHRMSN